MEIVLDLERPHHRQCLCNRECNHGTNVTVSGTLQSPLTSLLGVSIGNCVKSNGTASLNKLTVLNSITCEYVVS